MQLLPRAVLFPGRLCSIIGPFLTALLGLCAHAQYALLASIWGKPARSILDKEKSYFKVRNFRL